MCRRAGATGAFQRADQVLHGPMEKVAVWEKHKQELLSETYVPKQTGSPGIQEKQTKQIQASLKPVRRARPLHLKLETLGTEDKPQSVSSGRGIWNFLALPNFCRWTDSSLTYTVRMLCQDQVCHHNEFCLSLGLGWTSPRRLLLCYLLPCAHAGCRFLMPCPEAHCIPSPHTDAVGC